MSDLTVETERETEPEVNTGSEIKTEPWIKTKPEVKTGPEVGTGQRSNARPEEFIGDRRFRSRAQLEERVVRHQTSESGAAK